VPAVSPVPFLVGDVVNASQAPPPLSRAETVGAWLHLWTPPRDAEVPAVPWRRLGIGAAIAAVVLAVLAAWLVPRIDTAKRHEAATERRALAALSTRERAILTRDQRLHAGRAAALPSNAAAAQRIVLADLQRAITADAHARTASGTLADRVLTTTCTPFTRGPVKVAPPPTATAAAYECTAVTNAIPRSSHNLAGAIGYPFWARVNFPRGTFQWCKVNLRPGERGIGGEAAVVALPAPCNLLGG
jgi:type II secretory pathway pseudopilin PulG